jgi:hypothetical protein
MRMNGAAAVEDTTSLLSHVPAPCFAGRSPSVSDKPRRGPISPTQVFAQLGARLTPQGGGDVATTWTDVI